jgi:hypothetical protein
MEYGDSSNDSDYVYESAPDSGSDDEPCDDVGGDVIEWEFSTLDEVLVENIINGKNGKDG